MRKLRAESSEWPRIRRKLRHFEPIKSSLVATFSLQVISKLNYFITCVPLSFRPNYSKMSPLTPEQTASYHENGYLLLRADEHKLVDPIELKRWTQEVQVWPRVKGKWLPYDEININGERQLMRTERFIDYHPEFKSLVCGEQLAEILKAVSGDVYSLDPA